MPPQANPLLAMVSTAGLLELNVTATRTGRPLEFFAEAEKFSVAPTSSDALLAERLMEAGGVGEAGVLLVPQPARPPISNPRMTANRSELHLPMHPPRPRVSFRARLVLLWKISSVEAANLFSKSSTSFQPGLTIDSKRAASPHLCL